MIQVQMTKINNCERTLKELSGRNVNFFRNYLCLLVDPHLEGAGPNNYLVSLCLVFQRIASQQTRLSIQMLSNLKLPTRLNESAFNFLGESDWNETQHMLNSIAWGKVVVRDEVASLIL